ncbi:RNA-binding protein 7 [Danaus plexippus]|uniref:RNA-binding protein 7 n=1 Tax=Danaus plexippus TaxID=13037 RepID=UPI002AB12CDC|nr:RNA-binding protein 7 [Danaus plexippus]
MIEEANKTVWCGNLSEQVTEELLYELFVQAGPVEKVIIPKDKDGRQKNFAFITYCHEVSVPYAINLFRGTALFHRTLLLQNRGRMALLPPPIRCYGPEASLDFNAQSSVTQQFTDMTDKLKEENPQPVHLPTQRQDMSDKLVVASLQGNWSNRHHPYRSKEKFHNRDDYRPRDGHDNYNRVKTSHWRERRAHRTRRRD